MSRTSDADRERNREIARNEEIERIVGSARVSIWAIAIAAMIGAVLFAIGWIAYRL
jgi:adenylate kinase